MRLLLVRHGKAEESDGSKWPDDSLRPLSQRGIEEFRKSATQLGQVLTPEALLTSPYVRAMQTARILEEFAKWPAPEAAQEIAHGEFSELVDTHFENGTETLAIVGHEPTISAYVSELISGSLGASVRMKPGTAACVKLDSPGSGELQWLAPTRLFR